MSMTPHEKAILEITRLAEGLIQKGAETEDGGLIAIGLSLRIYMAAAVNGDLEEFIGHIHKFIEIKVASQMEQAETAHIGRAMQALRFVNNPINLN